MTCYLFLFYFISQKLRDCVWWMEEAPVLAGWRLKMLAFGALYVLMTGTWLKPKLSARNWDVDRLFGH